MPIKLSILVFVASPLDYAHYRHTALYIEYEPNPILKSSLSEVVGSTGFYSYSERTNWEIPTSSTNLARIVPVSIMGSVPVSVLRETVASVPIPEKGEWGDDWNSQDWVSDVLGRFVEIGILDVEMRDRAVDEMVNAVLEAGDEEVLA